MAPTIILTISRRTIESEIHGHQIRAMIRLTLSDGTRIQIAADDVTDVETRETGTLVHLKTGETVQVLQNAQIIETRLKIACRDEHQD